MYSLTGEEKFYCSDIHLDLHKGGKEHEWGGMVVDFRIKIGAG